eukprot:8801621-Pyramimonas_sp.AAC.1
MWRKAAVIEHAEKEQCVQLTLPLRSRNTSVGTLHSLLEGYQIRPSNPERGGNVEKSNFGIFFRVPRREPFDPRAVRDGGKDFQ